MPGEGPGRGASAGSHDHQSSPAHLLSQVRPEGIAGVCFSYVSAGKRSTEPHSFRSPFLFTSIQSSSTSPVDRKHFKRVRVSVVTLQKHFRSHLLRRRFLRERKAALVLQKHRRGQVARTRVRKLRGERRRKREEAEGKTGEEGKKDQAEKGEGESDEETEGGAEGKEVKASEVNCSFSMGRSVEHHQGHTLLVILS